MRRTALSFFILVLFVGSAAAQTPADSRLKQIIDSKSIKIAYRADATPFSFLKDGEPIGYTIDLCKLVAGSIGLQFSIQGLKIVWVPVTSQTRFETVASGKADMECGSSTVTLGRLKQVDFSSFTFVESTSVLVKKASGIGGFSGLAGKKIAVVAGTTNERAVAEQARRLNPNATLVSVKDRDSGMAALDGGAVDAFASDKLLLVGAPSQNRQDIVMLPEDLSIEPYAIALPRGDWALRLAVNTGLAQIYSGPQIGKIFEKWFAQIGLQPGVLLKSVYTLGALAD
jgi:glutamate/aspartate transport system substrate-binding protein